MDVIHIIFTLALILKNYEKIECINLKIIPMTLLKVYNKNGHCRQSDVADYANPVLRNEFPFTSYFRNEQRYSSPRVNIKESADSLSIEMEVPGINKSLLKIRIEKDLLKVSYRNEESKNDEKITYSEFNYNFFERSFRVPDTIDSEKMTAKYNEGILLIHLPKKEDKIDKGPRNIEIS